METIPQPEIKLAFRCSEEFQKTVKIAAINRGITVQQLCIEALCKHLKVPVPKDADAA